MWCILYLICLLLVGYGVVLPLTRGGSPLLQFGLSACLGPGIMSLWLIALSFAGHAPARWTILLAALAGTISIIVHCTRRSGAVRPPSTARPPGRWWAILAVIVFGYGCVAIGMDAIYEPTIEWDAFAIWQLKAKVLADKALIPGPDYFTNVALSYSHLRYPILVPMISAGVHAMTASLGDEQEKTPYLLMYIGLAAGLYAALRELRPTPPGALAATLSLISLPVLLAFGGTGTAEMALIAYEAFSIVFILRWDRSRRVGDWLAALLLNICMIWTKNEGLMIAAINCAAIIALAAAPRRPRALLAAIGYAILSALSYVPWMLYIRPLPRTDEDYLGRLTYPLLRDGLPKIPAIAREFLLEFTRVYNWGIFWFLLLGLAILSWKKLRDRRVIALWLVLLLQLLGYVPVYMVTNWHLDQLMLVTIRRLVLHLAPPAAILLALYWPTATSSQSPAPVDPAGEL